MTGVTIETRIDSKQVEQVFSKLQHVMGDTTPVLRAIGVGLVENTHARFEHAVDPQGRPWTPLKPDYAPMKKGPGILRESGMRGGLMGSITFRTGADSVEVGTNKIYAAVQHFGAVIRPVKATHLVFQLASGFVHAKQVTIPARPYLGISEADELTIAETLTDALARATNAPSMK